MSVTGPSVVMCRLVFLSLTGLRPLPIPPAEASARPTRFPSRSRTTARATTRGAGRASATGERRVDTSRGPCSGIGRARPTEYEGTSSAPPSAHRERHPVLVRVAVLERAHVDGIL